jgi:muconolactone delta-isomerase
MAAKAGYAAAAGRAAHLRSIRPRALAALSVSEAGVAIMLFLVVSTPRPERPSELAQTRQSFWPWIARYEAQGVCRQIYAPVGRGAVGIFDVEDNNALHQILNEWADIVPAHFDTYPLIEVEAAKRMLAAQAAAKRQ